MSPKSFLLTDALADYLVNHSRPIDDVLRDLAEETAALGGIAQMQISPEQGALLTLLTHLVGARSAVEVGTFTGYSSICIARGLPADGQLLCCDVSDEWTSIARRYWKRAGLENTIELRLGPAAETLEALPPEPTIDICFLDADKTGYLTYYEALVPRLRPGGVLLADNVLRNGTVVDETVDDEATRAVRAFNDRVTADERMESVILPVADGLTLARKR